MFWKKNTEKVEVKRFNPDELLCIKEAVKQWIITEKELARIPQEVVISKENTIINRLNSISLAGIELEEVKLMLNYKEELTLYRLGEVYDMICTCYGNEKMQTAITEFIKAAESRGRKKGVLKQVFESCPQLILLIFKKCITSHNLIKIEH